MSKCMSPPSWVLDPKSNNVRILVASLKISAKGVVSLQSMMDMVPLVERLVRQPTTTSLLKLRSLLTGENLISWKLRNKLKTIWKKFLKMQKKNWKKVELIIQTQGHVLCPFSSTKTELSLVIWEIQEQSCSGWLRKKNWQLSFLMITNPSDLMKERGLRNREEKSIGSPMKDSKWDLQECGLMNKALVSPSPDPSGIWKPKRLASFLNLKFKTSN